MKKLLRRIWFPVLVMVLATAGILGAGTPPERKGGKNKPVPKDTVIYDANSYRNRRKGNLEDINLKDSLFHDEGADAADTAAIADTLPRITARDTMKVPEELRLSDPFRFKYYVALVDSLTHVIVRDSLKHTSDSLRKSSLAFLKASEMEKFRSDSVLATSDSLDWRRIDSIYLADSAAFAKAEFLKWYNSLSPKERRKYDKEQLIPIKLHEADSIRRAKEEKQERRDSTIKATPRILETFAISDSLYFERMIVWKTDPDFHKMEMVNYDTTYNYRYYDYPWQHKDVNATWLGVAGSPVQYYDYFNRKSRDGVDFYAAQEPWSVGLEDLNHFNTKVAYTELCYFGTILAANAKESDNLHLLTTQNITPALNFSLMYDRFGGGGILENEETRNKVTVVNVNYLGKRYLAHGGMIRNNVSRGENGGVRDIFWIRDTTVEAREVNVMLKDASSKVSKNTFYLEQQMRIPFNFINKMKAKRDSTFIFNADSLDKDITTAFIGHTSEYSTFSRKYTDKIGSADTFARDFYNNTFRFNPNGTADSLGVKRIDNKVFLRLQPWSSKSLVSKVEAGVGHRFMQYFDSTSVRPSKHNQNSFYLYGGAEGQFLDFLSWDAKGDYVLAGWNFSDLGLEANAKLEFYPFRKARKSPLSIRGHFETSLREPNYYQQVMSTNHYAWENDFGKASTTKIEGSIDIPHWGTSAKVGYALLANNVYYDSLSIARQNPEAMSVLSASLQKNFRIGMLHLDNQVLMQLSSKPDVVPVPSLAANLRWYIQFVAQKAENKVDNVMEMQIGANAYMNTPWYAPAFNPALGVFYNQNERQYTNGPWFDIFVNIQWKQACLFIKYQNAGMGWPMKKRDYFSADRYVITENGMSGLKLGIYWPFYAHPGKPHADEGGHR